MSQILIFYENLDAVFKCENGNNKIRSINHPFISNLITSREIMLMYGKEASNRKQEIDRQHYTIPNQRPKDKHCGKI